MFALLAVFAVRRVPLAGSEARSHSTNQSPPCQCHVMSMPCHVNLVFCVLICFDRYYKPNLIPHPSVLENTFS